MVEIAGLKDFFKKKLFFVWELLHPIRSVLTTLQGSSRSVMPNVQTRGDLCFGCGIGLDFGVDNLCDYGVSGSVQSS